MSWFNRKKSILEGGKALVKMSKRITSSLLSENDDTSPTVRTAEFKSYKRAYERVPLVTAIIDVQADQAVQEFYFEGPNKEKLTKLADDTTLLRFFHNITKSMLIYGNAYAEIVKKGDEIVELKPLNPIWIDVWRKNNGDVIGYSQIISDKHLVLWGSTGKAEINKKFKTRIASIDSIAHFKYNVIASEKYGRGVLAPLMKDLQIKLDMEEDLKKVIFKYVAPLIWAKVGNDQFPANESVVSTISSTLKDLQAESEITTSHLVELGVLDFNAKGMDIKTPIDHVESQIVTGGQVPPVLLGRSGEGTSESEVQLRSFGRHIKSIQRELKYEFEEQIVIKQAIGTKEDKLIWEKTEEREWEIDVDIIRGLVTDGVLTPQKANDLLPPRFREELPDPVEQAAKMAAATGANQGPPGEDGPRPTQRKDGKKVKDNPKDPTQTTKDKKSLGKRVKKTDRKVPIK